MNSSPTDADQQDEPRDPRRVMRLAVLGATGSVGRELVTQAVAAGHEVTALVRERPEPGEIDDRIALLLDAASADAVERTVVGSDAVVNALGHAKGAREDILARATANVIAAMRAGGIDRLVVLSSPAVEDADDVPGFFYRLARLVMRVAIASVVRDHREQAALIEKSGVAWTLVRGPVADLADFMIATSTNGDFVRMKPLVSA
jgi:uncharacterized protein YbjT (DUF2867 family)